MIVGGGVSDAMPRVAAFLPWDDLAAVTRCCRATRDAEASPFYRAWVARSALVLPPDSRVSHEILSTMKDINAVVLPHSQWLGMVVEDPTLRPRLARVHRVVVDRQRFQINPAVADNMAEIAHSFPSTTDLSLRQVDKIEDVSELRGFRALKRLELVTFKKNMVCPITAADFSTLEEITLYGIDIATIGANESWINLRSFSVDGLDTIRDLAFLMHLPKLTKLCLGISIVERAAVPALLAIAPQLIRFECGAVESIWPHNMLPVDPVDVDRLTLAFKRLEQLHINLGYMQDLGSVSRINTLRRLCAGKIAAVDLSPLLKLQHLEWLDFTSMAPVDTTPLATLADLKSLKYSWPGQHAIDHTNHASFPRLLTCEGPSDGLQRMQDFDNLRSLTVSTATNTTTLDLGHLSAPRLRQLSLRTARSCNIRDLHLRFPRLGDLAISALQWNAESQDLSLSQLAGLQHLESLHISSYPCQVEFDQLARLPKLQKLLLPNCNATSLKGIEKLTSLRELQFSLQRRTTVLDMAPLESLPRLQVLRLSNCTIADVRPLTRVRSLRVVELPRGTNFEPLIVAYHATRLGLVHPGTPGQPGATALELQQVKQMWSSCLWGAQYFSTSVRLKLRAMEAEHHGANISCLFP